MKVSMTGKTVASTLISNDHDAWIEQALNHRKMKVYRWFADDLLMARATRYPQGGGIVAFFDMRYGNPMETDHYLWGARVYVDQDGTLGRVERFYNRSFSLGELIKRVFQEITTA